MAKGKEIQDLSTDKLKKLLLTYNILAILGGLGAIAALVFYFLNREDNQDLLIVGIAFGVGISFVGTIANKIKQEIKKRADK